MINVKKADSIAHVYCVVNTPVVLHEVKYDKKNTLACCRCLGVCYVLYSMKPQWRRFWSRRAALQYVTLTHALGNWMIQYFLPTEGAFLYVVEFSDSCKRGVQLEKLHSSLWHQFCSCWRPPVLNWHSLNIVQRTVFPKLCTSRSTGLPCWSHTDEALCGVIEFTCLDTGILQHNDKVCCCCQSQSQKTMDKISKYCSTRPNHRVVSQKYVIILKNV